MSETRTFVQQDILKMEKVPRLNLINSISGFKSANLIGTIDKSGRENLAIFNSVIHIGSNPPLLGLLVRPLAVPRHTYGNIKETGWFTINHVRQDFYKKAHQTSGKFPKDISEFEACGLEPEYRQRCPAPFVKESVISMGLTYEEETEIKANGTILIIGALKELVVPVNSIEGDGFVNLEKAGSLTISGLDSYHKTVLLGREPYVRLSDEISREG